MQPEFQIDQTAASFHASIHDPNGPDGARQWCNKIHERLARWLLMDEGPPRRRMNFL